MYSTGYMQIPDVIRYQKKESEDEAIEIQLEQFAKGFNLHNKNLCLHLLDPELIR